MDLSKTIIHTTDERGEPIARVPLGRGRQGWATIDESDLQLLEMLGLSLNWYLLNGLYVVAPAIQASGKLLIVARVLLDAGRGFSIRYLNGDPKDLRRGNLSLEETGKGRRRDRNYITPWKEKNMSEKKKREHVYLT